MPEHISGSVGIATGSGTCSATAITRTNFSILHLLSAAGFSRKTGELEVANLGTEFGPFWEEILSQATAAILTAVAALEAYVNELFVDHEMLFPQLQIEVVAKLCELYEFKPALEKYELALLLRQAKPLVRGASPYQDVSALIKLRNGLIHFKPEWSNQQQAHAKLANTLKHRIALSPFFPNTEPLFPRGWVSHSCTSWAVRSVKELILDFERHAGLTSRLGPFAERLNAL